MRERGLFWRRSRRAATCTGRSRGTVLASIRATVQILRTSRPRRGETALQLGLDHGKTAPSSRRIQRVSFSVALAAWLSASAARACPDCAVGRAARSQVWNQGFTDYLAALLLPFAIVFIASAWAERLGQRGKRR